MAMNKQQSADKRTNAIRTVFVVGPWSTLKKRCVEVESLEERCKVAPEVAELTMGDESNADGVNVVNGGVFNADEAIEDEFVESSLVYFSTWFDLPHVTAGYWWKRGEGVVW